MARQPDGLVARGIPVTTRYTPAEEEALDRQRAYRGGMTRSAYLRWLVAQDGRRIAQEQARYGEGNTNS